MKVVSMLFAGVVVVVGVLGFQWYRYVTNTESPYNEVGIALNSIMPGPINAWGCAKLKENFGDLVVPPRGCHSEDDTRSWKSF